MKYSDKGSTKLPHHRRVSVVLKEFMDNAPGPRITLDELRHALADRAFAILMLVFALPNLIPVPVPGISTVLGLPLLFLSWQMVTGKKAPWFPKWLAVKSFSHKDLGIVLFHAIPHLIRLERILRPRASWMVQPKVERVLAVLCVIMAVFITLPIPLGNWLPAFTICLFSLAILEHDGIFAIFGIISSIISTILVSSVVLAFIKATIYFLQRFLF